MADVVEIRQIIEGGEKLTVEFKKELSPKQERSICKEIAALSTAKGGHLIIGVEDNGRIVGVSDPEDILNKIERWCSNYIKPLPQIDRDVVKIDGMNVVVVEVADGIFPFYMYDDRVYTRVGTSSVIVNPQELIDIIRGRDLEDLVTSLESNIAIALSIAQTAQSSAVAATYAIAPAIIGQGDLATMDYENVQNRILRDIEASPTIAVLRSALASANSMIAAQGSSASTIQTSIEVLKLENSVREAAMQTEIAVLSSTMATLQSSISLLKVELATLKSAWTGTSF